MLLSEIHFINPKIYENFTCISKGIRECGTCHGIRLYIFVKNQNYWTNGGATGGGMGAQPPHFSKRLFLRSVQKCNKIGLSAGMSQIKHFCHLIKRSTEYS